MEDEEVSRIRKAVEKRFRVYDVRWDESGVMFYITLTPPERNDFQAVQEDISSMGYIAGLRRLKGEDIIIIGTRQERKERKPIINVVLLILTIITTIWAGSITWTFGYGKGSDFMDSLIPENLLMGGLTFALPLMFILGVHEMGHYLMAKRYGMNASLPYFIPAPPLPFGTFGAFISIRDPMPSRKALFDIGVAGPVAGFLAAIPVIMIGLALSTADIEDIGRSGEMSVYNSPLLFLFLQRIVPPSGTLTHPTAFAGWVGLLVTAMNLLPAGQLDGGHIARAFLRENARYAAYISIGILLFLGFFFNGWIIFAILILFLGVQHPPPLDDITGLGGKRKVLGVAVLVILGVSFVPIPMETMYYQAPEHSIEIGGFQDVGVVPAGGQWTYVIPIENDGNRNGEVDVNVTFNSTTYTGSDDWTISSDPLNFTIDDGNTHMFNVTITAPVDASIWDNATFNATFDMDDGPERLVEFMLVIGDVTIAIDDHGVVLPREEDVYLGIDFSLIDYAGSGPVLLSVHAPNGTGLVNLSSAPAIPFVNGTIIEAPAGPGDHSLFIRFDELGANVITFRVDSLLSDFHMTVETTVIVKKG